MAWCEILAALKAQFTAAQVARTIEIGMFNSESFDLTPDEDGRYGAVFLLRGKEEEEELFKGGEGTAYLSIENWVRADTFEKGYEMLAAQEARCKESMAVFFSMAAPLGAIDLIYANLKEVAGNVGSALPCIGSRMTLRVQWSMRTA